MVRRSKKNLTKNQPVKEQEDDDEPSFSSSRTTYCQPTIGFLVFALLLVAFNVHDEARKLLYLPSDNGFNSRSNATATTITTTTMSKSALSYFVGIEPTDKASTDNADSIHHRDLQAKVGLHVMEARNSLTTDFSTHSFVLQHGFPRKWRPCVLERILQQQQQSSSVAVLQVAVVGGSTAARPGNNCGGMEGRYSNLLHSKLQKEEAFIRENYLNMRNNNQKKNALLQVNIQNFGQGATISTDGTLLLDEYVVPGETNILLWDYSVNDHRAGGGPPDAVQTNYLEEARKLDFFLTRVKALHTQANKPLPAIMILQMWPVYIGRFLYQRQEQETLDHGAMDHEVGQLLDAYIAAGWDITVINVGASIPVTLELKANVSTLLDDDNHPSCQGNHFIAEMVQHTIYSNWNIIGSQGTTSIGNDHSSCRQLLQQQSTAMDKTKSMIPPHKELWANTETPYQDLWTDLFREDAKVGSITPWEPHVANQTVLNIVNRQDISSWQTKLTEGSVPERADRKSGFIVPKCGAENGVVDISQSSSWLSMRLQEPDLKWIGLSIWGRDLHIFINDVKVAAPTLDITWNIGPQRMSHWIPISNSKNTEATTDYKVSFCSSKTNEAYLQFLIGVSVPKL